MISIDTTEKHVPVFQIFKVPRRTYLYPPEKKNSNVFDEISLKNRLPRIPRINIRTTDLHKISIQRH